MKEIKVYIRVPVEQEPEKTDRYYTDCSNSPILIWRKIHGWHKYEYIEKIGKIDIVKYHPLFYLKPISLTEYMVGAIKEYNLRLSNGTLSIMYCTGWKKMTEEDFVEYYLKKEGIILQ